MSHFTTGECQRKTEKVFIHKDKDSESVLDGSVETSTREMRAFTRLRQRKPLKVLLNPEH
jgi:hypothetical protein